MKNHAMPLPCEAWAEKLATARLATLSLHEDDALKAHLESCEACTAVQCDYDEMDELIGKITCTKTLTALPPQLLQLWEEQNRQIALHTLAVQHNDQSKIVALGTSSHLSVPTSQVALATLSIPELAEQCKREIHQYRRGEPANHEYGMELFRRALIQREPFAWEAVQQCFNESMLRWMHSHPLRAVACRFDSEENYVAHAFTRFWQATVSHRAIEFRTLAAALGYLRASLNAAILDTLRAYSRPREVYWPNPDFLGESAVEDSDDNHELWDAIRSFLQNEREQRLAYLLYYCGLKPRQIVQLCPNEFSEVHEIFRLTRNIVDRLRRNKDRLLWLLSDEDF